MFRRVWEDKPSASGNASPLTERSLEEPGSCPRPPLSLLRPLLTVLEDSEKRETASEMADQQGLTLRRWTSERGLDPLSGHFLPQAPVNGEGVLAASAQNHNKSLKWSRSCIQFLRSLNEISFLLLVFSILCTSSTVKFYIIYIHKLQLTLQTSTLIYSSIIKISSLIN